MRKFTLGFLLFVCAAFADDPRGMQDDVLACDLKGIILVGNWEQVRSEPDEEGHCVVSHGVALLSRNSSFLETLKANYIGRPLTQSVLWELKTRILDFYSSENQPFAFVAVPKQDFSRGVLQVVVEEAKLGQVRVKGNHYYSGTDLMSYIRTKPGQPILAKQVVEDLAWMNKNPFRRTDGIFVPGKRPGTVDLDLVTIDRWPYRVYVGADNTGTIATERERLFFGFNFGKTIIKDADVSYQFTCSPNWNRFFAHTLSTRIPCPWRHEFIAYGGYSQVEPELEEKNEKETGVSWQVDGRYRIPIMDTPGLMQTLVIGYDFKETSTRVKRDRHTVVNATADINQFMIGYEFGWRDASRRASLIGEVYGNPGGITEKNKTRDYEDFRFDAGAQYAYLKVVHSFAQRTPGGWWFSYDITGQVASRNLLPSEQFTMTGYNAVRGFEERILLLDSAAILNLSIETPHWSPSKFWGSKKAIDEFYLLVFLDSGIGANHQRAPQERKLKTLGSIGPGARYQFNRYVTARFDYGIQLWHRGFFNPTDSRYNFGLIVSY